MAADPKPAELVSSTAPTGTPARAWRQPPQPLSRIFSVVRAARVLMIVLVVGALALPPLSATGALLGPLNDLLALGQGGGDAPARVTIQRNSEPPFVATPQAKCGPGSRKEPGIQGRVPQGANDT